MALTAKFLNDLDGTMYTGCDINSTNEDMGSLSEQCPYVLAGIGNRDLNPNDATAYGVLGALETVSAAKCGGVSKTRFVVHGCGNVGATVARELVAAGATVYVTDAIPGRASTIEGATDISEAVLSGGKDGWGAVLPDHDIFVPCSMSQIITTKAATDLPASAIVGATNQPFATAEAEAAFASRGTLFVPECITSAGAILADSIEHYAEECFAKSPPSMIYDFCRETVSKKTTEAMQIAAKSEKPVAKVVPELITSVGAGDNVIGREFQSWWDEMSSTAEAATVPRTTVSQGSFSPTSVNSNQARMFSSVSKKSKA